MTFKKIFLGLSLILLSGSALEATVVGNHKPTDKRHAIAMLGEPKYKSDFKHFDYVNPKAPKGGEMTIGAIGTFDSFNPYSFKGIPAAGLGVLGPSLVYDYLMVTSADEPETLYGLIAESVEMPGDRSWMIFNLNKEAKFSDGHPVTAEDVKFSAETLREHGQAFMQSHYKKVEKIEIINTHRIKFYFKQKEGKDGKKFYEQDLPMIVARLAVFPKHIMDGKDFSKLAQENVVGSGPYKIKDVKMGRSISFERRKDYWAKDLNVRVGTGNFDEIQYDYYRNIDVMFEAFKAGEFDVLIEGDPKRWATSYNFKAVKDGRVKRLELAHKRPVGFHGFVMNTRRDVFKDRKFREAISLAFDFNWVNLNLYHKAFTRSKSYFENTDLASEGLPSDEELKLLNPHKDKVADEVFTKAYEPPFYKDAQEKRRGLRRAKKLLKEAGYEVKGGKLIDPASDKPVEFEIMITRSEEEKIAISFQRELKNLGINLHVKTVDESQYWGRTPGFDFDMVIFRWSGSLSPSGGVLQNRWGVDSRDRKGSLNYMGVKNPVIDVLCGYVNKAKSRETLATATKALDRVLLWGHYVIPLFHDNKNRVAIWDKFGHPPFDPLMGISTSTWWANSQSKAAP